MSITAEAVEKLAGRLADEDYPPVDGPYQDRSYGAKLSLASVRGFWRRTARLIRAGKAPPEVGLYVHWPFCRDACDYCYCDCRIPARENEAERCLGMIEREMRAFRDVLRGVALSSVSVCGGTPTSAPVALLDRLLGLVHYHFAVRERADVAVEASPATLTPAKMEAFQRHGVRRIDLGVDTLDRAVLQRTGRRQDWGAVLRVFREAAEAGIAAEAGLVYGLEGQSAESFLRDVLKIAALRPSTVRLYGFDPRPQTAFVREGKTLGPGKAGEIRKTLELADKLMRKAGYRSPPGAWSVPSSILGLGWSAKSRAFGSGWYQHPVLGDRSVPARGLPAFSGAKLSLEDEQRRFLIRGLAVTGRVSRRGFHELFKRDIMDCRSLAGPLSELGREDVLCLDADHIHLAGPRASLRRLYDETLFKRLARDAGRRPHAAGAAGTECRVYISNKWFFEDRA